MWPDHCVQGSIGADFHPYLDRCSRRSRRSRRISYSYSGRALPGSALTVASPPLHTPAPRLAAHALHRADTDVVVRMGTNPKADSYSAFGDAFGGRFEKTELEQVLRDASIDHVRSWLSDGSSGAPVLRWVLG